MTLPDFDKIIYKVIGTRITQIEDTLQITEIQLNTVYNLISKKEKRMVCEYTEMSKL